MDHPQDKSNRGRWVGVGIGLVILALVGVVVLGDGGETNDQDRVEDRADEIVIALNGGDLTQLCELLAPLEGNLFEYYEVPDGASDEDRIDLATPEAYTHCEQDFAEDRGNTADLKIDSVQIDDAVDGREYATVVLSGTVNDERIEPGSTQQFLDMVKVGDEWYYALSRIRPPATETVQPPGIEGSAPGEVPSS